jgi:hypothetical protein
MEAFQKILKAPRPRLNLACLGARLLIHTNRGRYRRTEKVSLAATMQPLTLRLTKLTPRYISRKASYFNSTISLYSTALGPAVETKSLSLHLPEVPAGSVALSYLSSGEETVAAAPGWVSRQIGILGSRAQHLSQRP